jgi:hypothetical protein
VGGDVTLCCWRLVGTIIGTWTDATQSEMFVVLMVCIEMWHDTWNSLKHCLTDWTVPYTVVQHNKRGSCTFFSVSTLICANMSKNKFVSFTCDAESEGKNVFVLFGLQALFLQIIVLGSHVVSKASSVNLCLWSSGDISFIYVISANALIKSIYDLYCF